MDAYLIVSDFEMIFVESNSADTETKKTEYPILKSGASIHYTVLYRKFSTDKV